MLSNMRSLSSVLLFSAFVLVANVSSAAAQDASWRVSKSSGEVWIDAPGAQSVALSADTVLSPGASVRTGANGRVLLMRGTETIMVSPNSVMQIPAAKSGNSGMTTVLQRSGSLLFDVEKQNVRHFEVSTPYLAAVVKGTQFRVTVDEGGSRVEVLRGQVHVTDYKSGQRALVNPSQMAAVSLRGAPGLALSGSGPMSPIESGSPQAPPVTPAIMPAAPRSAAATTPELPQQRTASAAASAPAAAATRWSQPDRGSDASWGDGFLGWLGEKLGVGRQRKGEDNLTIVAVPLAVGLSVFVGAMAMRRRRSNKPQDPRDRA
ncbi:MAG: FecR family protein [Xanthobacteraceae bacterium]|nr:FecR family protein [Xanthobacteraceae bacterium]